MPAIRLEKWGKLDYSGKLELPITMEPSLLPSLAWFVHIARHRSFTRAAAEMGVSRAALSQNLKALEDRLDVKLLYRTTRDMSLTEEGQLLYDALRPSFDSIQRALLAIDEGHAEPSGLLKITVARIASRSVLEPHLAEFLGRYPQVSVELHMDDGFANIVAEGCDVGIRLGESLSEHVVAVPISPMVQLAVVGSPEYLQRRGVPQSPSDLTRHNCVGFRHTSSGAIFEWEFTSPDVENHDLTFNPNGTFTTNDDASMIRAALQGIGLVQHMDFAVREHLDDGSLVHVLEKWCRPFPGFYLYVPSRDHMPAKVRALLDFLVEKRLKWGQTLSRSARV